LVCLATVYRYAYRCIPVESGNNNNNNNDRNQNEVKEDEMGRACSTHGEKRNAYGILVGKSEGKRPLGTRIRRWDNIKTDLREILLPNGYQGLFLLGLKQQGSEADHSPPSGAEVKNCGAITPLPHVFMAWCLTN
jgi:hypothetical protein